MVQDKYIALYKELITQLDIYATLIRNFGKRIYLFYWLPLKNWEKFLIMLEQLYERPIQIMI